MSKTILALDVGTSMIKAVLVSAEGKSLFSASSPVEDSGRHDVEPEQIWRKAAAVIAEVVGKAGGNSEIGALIATGQGDGLWMLENGTETPASAVLWNSSDGAAVVHEWEIDGTIASHFDATGTVLWPGCSAALWRWFAKKEPTRAAKVTTVFTAKDFINFKLTGVIATDITDATIPFIDPASGNYSEAAFERLGCQDMRALVPEVLEAGSAIATLTAEAAALTGLSESTSVHMGLLDVAAMMIGSGLKNQGDVLAVLGTTAASISIVPPGKPSKNAVGATIYLPDGQHLRVMGSSSGTATLEWFLKTHGFEGANRYQDFWKEVEDAEPSGEIFLPYLNGERAPFLATNAFGVLLGITSTTTRGAIGRAVVEGVTMSLKHGMSVVASEANIAGQGSITLAGGGSMSANWAQLVANLAAKPVVVDGRPDLGALGVASLLLPKTADVSTSSLTKVNRFEPDKNFADWQAKYSRFLEYVDLFRLKWLKDSNDVSPLPKR